MSFGKQQVEPNQRKQAEEAVRSWSSEILNQIFTLAKDKKLPENIVLNGVGMITSFADGSKVCVNFTFGTIKGGKA